LNINGLFKVSFIQRIQVLCNINILKVHSSGEYAGSGVKIYDSYNSISHCDITNHNIGIYLYALSSNNNEVSNCSVQSSKYFGIYSRYSSGNTISHCIINSSANTGIRLYYTDHHTISYCNITNLGKGIDLFYSSNNSIFSNNFIENGKHVSVENGDNQWNNGYPTGGNYWDTYSGNDIYIYNGPNQDILGGDGIGDYTYYVLDEDNVDRYPLMEPWDVSKGTEDWNPWDNDAIITTVELQEMVNMWLNS